MGKTKCHSVNTERREVYEVEDPPLEEIQSLNYLPDHPPYPLHPCSNKKILFHVPAESPAKGLCL
jgi:hypothetical protein